MTRIDHVAGRWVDALAVGLWRLASRFSRVARLAEGLQIVRIALKPIIAVVRDFVIDVHRERDFAPVDAMRAQWLLR